MMNLFSDDLRRNPYPVYETVRRVSPVVREPGTGLWMVLDYEGVRRVLTEVETFSSRHGPDWMIFNDPPRHTKLRALVSKAFTPRSVVGLEGRVRALSKELLDPLVARGEMDVGAEYAARLPLLVIGEMLGVPREDGERFMRWNEVLVNMSHSVAGSPEAGEAQNAFIASTKEMGLYLGEIMERRRREPKDDLLSRLDAAEVDGERLTREEILGFFQLLLLAGSETTTHLIINAIICLTEWPVEMERLVRQPELVPGAVEEVLRYRSPVQWMYRKTMREVEMGGQVIPAGRLVLAVMGSANRDPKAFAEPDRFDVGRDPNPHLAFGHGRHFCMGAALGRMEGWIALTDLISRLKNIRLTSSEPWTPRRGLHVHGPANLKIKFDA